MRPVVLGNTPPRFFREFAKIWSLDERRDASNLAVDVADNVAIHHRDDRLGDQRSVAAQAGLRRRRDDPLWVPLAERDAIIERLFALRRAYPDSLRVTDRSVLSPFLRTRRPRKSLTEARLGGGA